MLQYVMEHIEKFRIFSGYKINRKKTKIILKCIMYHQKEDIIRNTECTIDTGSIKYLGITVIG